MRKISCFAFFPVCSLLPGRQQLSVPYRRTYEREACRLDGWRGSFCGSGRQRHGKCFRSAAGTGKRIDCVRMAPARGSVSRKIPRTSVDNQAGKYGGAVNPCHEQRHHHREHIISGILQVKLCGSPIVVVVVLVVTGGLFGWSSGGYCSAGDIMHLRGASEISIQSNYFGSSRCRYRSGTALHSFPSFPRVCFYPQPIPELFSQLAQD